jgi:hypothetical protein
MTGQQPHIGYAAGALQPRGARLALASVATGSRTRQGGESYFLQVDDDAADPSLLNQHAPFLLEHHHYLEDLLGDVREAWIEGGKLFAIIRFCNLPRADVVWSLLEADFRVGCSLGFEILAAEPVLGAPDHFCVTKWRATEVSACVVVGGADPRAHIEWRPFAELVERAERQRAVRLEIERAKCLSALKADAWRHWASNGAATAIADAVGVPEHEIAPPLASRSSNQMLLSNALNL